MNEYLSKASKAAKASKEGGEGREGGEGQAGRKGQEGQVGQVGQVAQVRSHSRKQMRVESPLSPELETLVYDLIGIGMRVHTAFGPGLRENVYEDAFVIGLEQADLSYQRQVPFNRTRDPT